MLTSEDQKGNSVEESEHPLRTTLTVLLIGAKRARIEKEIAAGKVNILLEPHLNLTI